MWCTIFSGSKDDLDMTVYEEMLQHLIDMFDEMKQVLRCSYQAESNLKLYAAVNHTTKVTLMIVTSKGQKYKHISSLIVWTKKTNVYASLEIKSSKSNKDFD